MSDENKDDQSGHVVGQEQIARYLELFNYNDHYEYYVTYQKKLQTSLKEFQFNNVKNMLDHCFVLAMHDENIYDAICYYNGASIELNLVEIRSIRVVNPDEYAFVVYTD
ncbi:hypothetical protein SAMN04488134_106169 [Amphibacillus marinus]|uniref:Uncharacterized protein n=1 Tax=Amphibacillus marinus TaxID=872970 RepID=A0A1H8P0Z9_9BACI|nr:hypothetical protein [Amphibacillus marinus]SEO35454.1 hypothetical protein SAMN04488134_106169 [Amphibacillus marinus]